MTKRVGIVGIGIMGTAMMRNLVKDGFEVVGYDIADGAMAARGGWRDRRRLAARRCRTGRDPDHLPA
jgi:3-hydroxyisobutyrate dehydrogenase-like beta-hydroxyacid dehydrogenase